MILSKGARAIVPQAPWPHASYTTSHPSVVTSEAEWRRIYNGGDYIPQSPAGAKPGDVVTVTSSVRDASYGAEGAFLDAWIDVRGPGWTGVSMVGQLVPIVPPGTKAIIVPDDPSQPLYNSSDATSSPISSLPRNDHVTIRRVVISLNHPGNEKSVRALVRDANGTSGWIDFDAVAYPGILPGGHNDTSVNDGCHCDFIKMTPDFLARQYQATTPI